MGRVVYDKAKMYRLCIRNIKVHQLLIITDVIGLLPCSHPTFYVMFPPGSSEFLEIKDLLNKNKIRVKADIRRKLKKSSKAAELLSLYRLAATSEERIALNQRFIDHTSNGKTIEPTTVIDLSGLTNLQLQQYLSIHDAIESQQPLLLENRGDDQQAAD